MKSPNFLLVLTIGWTCLIAPAFSAAPAATPTFLAAERIGQPVRKHWDRIAAAAFSPDGQRVVSASSDYTLRLWDATTGAPVGKAWPKQSNEIRSAAWSVDGGAVASGSADGILVVWNPDTAKIRWRAKTAHGQVLTVAFSPDGKIVASGGWTDKAIRLWDRETGKPIGKPLLGHRDLINALLFAEAGRTVVSAGSDGSVRFWDVATGAEKLPAFESKNRVLTRLALHPDGHTVAVSSANSFEIIDAQTGKSVAPPFFSPRSTFVAMRFMPDGARLLHGGSGDIHLTDWKTGRTIAQGRLGPQAIAWDFHFEGDKIRIAAVEGADAIGIWSMTHTGVPPPLAIRPVAKLFAGTAGRLASFSADGQRIILSDQNRVQVGDVTTGNILLDTPARQGHRPVGSALNADGTWAAVSDQGDTTRIWHVPTKKVVIEIRTYGVLAFSADGKRLVSGNPAGLVAVFDVATGQPLGQRVIAHEMIESLAFSPDGKTLFVGTRHSARLMGDLYRFAGDVLTPLGEPWRGVGNHVAISADGERLLAFDRSRAVILDARTGLHRSSPLRGLIDSASFSRDGRLLYTVGEDGVIGVWDPQNGRRLAMASVWPGQLFEHRTWFSPEGRRVLAFGRATVGDQDGALHVSEVIFRPPAATPSNPTVLPPKHVAVPVPADANPLTQSAASANFHHASGALVLGTSGSIIVRRSGQTCTTEHDTIPDRDPNSKDVSIIRSVMFSPDGRLVAAGPDANHMRIYDAETCKRVSVVKGFRHGAQGFLPNGRLVLAVKEGVRWVDSRTGKTERTQRLALDGKITELTTAPNGALAVGTDEGEVILVSTRPNAAPRRMPRVVQGFVTSLLFSPDGKTLIVGSGDGKLRVVDVDVGQVRASTQFRADDEEERDYTADLAVARMAFNADQSRLAVAHSDGTLRVWDMQTGAALTHRLAGDDHEVLDLIFDRADGTLLTIGGAARPLRWKLP